MLAKLPKPESSMPWAQVTDQTQLGSSNSFYYKHSFTLSFSANSIKFLREDQKVLVLCTFKVRAPQKIKVCDLSGKCIILTIRKLLPLE